MYVVCPSNSGFLNLGTLDILGHKIICCGDVLWRMFSSIPGLYQPDACRTNPTSHPSHDNQKYIQMWQMSPEEQYCPWLGTTNLTRL